MYLSLSSNGPVKWNHNQEASLLQDVSPFSPAYDGRSTVTLGERTRELYLQFLWLPEVRVTVVAAVFVSLSNVLTPGPVRYAIESIRRYGSTAREAMCECRLAECERRRCAHAARCARWHFAYREVV